MKNHLKVNMDEYLSFNELRQLVYEYSGNDMPGIFIVDKDTGIEKDFVVFIDDGDIVFEVING